jgi:hypothetical protein
MDAAVKVFQEERRTKLALLRHTEKCMVCRSLFLSLFWTCRTQRTLTSDHAAALKIAEEHYARLMNLKLELQIVSSPEAAPTTEWLEGLYNLSDDKAR